MKHIKAFVVLNSSRFFLKVLITEFTNFCIFYEVEQYIFKIIYVMNCHLIIYRYTRIESNRNVKCIGDKII